MYAKKTVASGMYKCLRYLDLKRDIYISHYFKINRETLIIGSASSFHKGTSWNCHIRLMSYFI